jgi:aminoglycoside phosphotransferase (APT) family kinase protein
MTAEAQERTGERVTALLGRAGIPAGRIVRHAPLTGGTYNGLYVVELTGGERLVLKVPPSPDLPRLRYEAELLYGEALFYRHAAEAEVPAPALLAAECAEAADPYLLMSHRPGVPWYGVAGTMACLERDRLRCELGSLMARLHAVRGPAFGYPAQSTGPLTDRWAAAFGAMTGALLDDAVRYDAWLPLPVDSIREQLAAAAPVLAEVTVPALVHFDLWPGNILLDGPAGERRISALIDGERMMWGDPLADFASLALLLGDAERDSAFLSGYAAGGGRADFDGPALRRIALYRSYLYLIMLIETVPRGTEGETLAWLRTDIADRLVAALRAAAGPRG